MSNGFFLASYQEMAEYFLRKTAQRVAKTIELSLDKEAQNYIFKLPHFDEKFEDVVLHICQKNKIEFSEKHKYLFLLHVRGELDIIKEARNFDENLEEISENFAISQEMEVVEDAFLENQPEDNIPEHFYIESLREQSDSEMILRAWEVARIIAYSLNEKEQDFIFKLAYTDERFYEAVSLVCEGHGIKFETNQPFTFLVWVRCELDIFKLVRDIQKREAYCKDDVVEITESSSELDMLEEVGEDIVITEDVLPDYSPETLSELSSIERDLYQDIKDKSDVSERAQRVADIILSQDQNFRDYIFSLFQTDKSKFREVLFSICEKAGLLYTLSPPSYNESKKW